MGNEKKRLYLIFRYYWETNLSKVIDTSFLLVVIVELGMFDETAPIFSVGYFYIVLVLAASVIKSGVMHVHQYF